MTAISFNLLLSNYSLHFYRSQCIRCYLYLWLSPLHIPFPVGCSSPPTSLKGGGGWVFWDGGEQIVEGWLVVLCRRVALFLSFLLSYFWKTQVRIQLLKYPPHLQLSHSLLLILDIPINYEIRKKRYRAQSCKFDTSTSFPSAKKLTGKCTVRIEIRSSQNILCGSALKSMIPNSDSSVRSKVQVGQLMALLLIAVCLNW